jgi:leader peptidase (prepilin peptidase)/N-methyltransferase
MIELMQNSWVAWSTVIALGLVMGSFANVLIYRLPRERSVAQPGSQCPGCATPLRWYHNIPVFSWVVLRGKCGFCRQTISWVYPLVELICAGLFVAFYARYGLSVTTLGFWYLSVTLVAIFFIDLEFRIIPNSLTYSGIIVGIAIAFVSPHMLWWKSILGAAVGIGLFIAVAFLGRLLFRKDSMGGGDVKLAGVLGAFLGADKLLVVLMLSAVIGAVISIVALRMSARMRRDHLIPFGPFLAIAAVLVSFYGEEIVDFYIRNFLP